MKLKDRAVFSGFADEIAPELDTQLRVLHECGIAHMEIRGVNGKNIDLHTEEETREIARRLREAGVSVSAVGSPIGKIDVRDDFEPHFEKFRHVARQAKLLGTKYIRMFSFYMPAGEDPAAYRGEVLRRLRALRDHAAEQGLVLLHENEKGIYGDNAARCLDLFRELGGPVFRCSFDFANFVQCRQDTREAFDLLRPYIEYIHVKDARWETGTVVPAGEGDGRLAELLAELDRSGYSGFLSLEPHLTDFLGFAALEQGPTERKADAGQGEIAFKTAFAALKKLLDAA